VPYNPLTSEEYLYVQEKAGLLAHASFYSKNLPINSFVDSGIFLISSAFTVAETASDFNRIPKLS